MTFVVIDTNALLLPFTDGTDLEGGLEALVGAHERVVPAPVMEELARLASEEGMRGQAAKGALRLAARARIEATHLPGDDGVLEVARRLAAVVVTNDRALQQECARSGLRCVASRGHGRLAWRTAGS